MLATARSASSRRDRSTATYAFALLAAVLVTSLLWGFAQRADASIYYAAQTKVGRVNLDGTGANVNFITGLTTVAGVAVDGTYVYWSSNLSAGNGTIGRAKLDGTEVDKSFITGASRPQAIAVDGTYIYWGNVETNTIGRAKLDGTEVNQSFITGPEAPNGLAVDAGHIYWSNNKEGANSIGRANLDGSEVNEKFITGATGPLGVAVDSEHIYWANFFNSTGTTIGRANLDGTMVNKNFITNIRAPRSVAVDGEHVYWANFSPNVGNYGRANIDGTDVNNESIKGVNTPFGIAADGRRAATTTVDCEPGFTGRATTCTATVTDVESGTPQQPTGTVAFSSTGTGKFGAGGAGEEACALAPAATAGEATCTVTYTPAAVGTETITAAFGGGPTAISGSGTTELTVAVPTAATATSATCAPNPVYTNIEVICAATVIDTSAAPTAPTGEVAFTTDKDGSFEEGTFPDGKSCALVPQGADRASCQVRYSSNVFGTRRITAAYKGSSSQDPSKSQAVALEILRVHKTKSTLACATDAPVATVADACTVTVIDSDPNPVVPTGQVSFSSEGGAFDPPTCTLVPFDKVSATCTTSFTARAKGVVNLSADFDGAPAFFATSAVTALKVSAAPVAPRPLDCPPGFAPTGNPPICKEPAKQIQPIPPRGPSNSFSRGRPTIDPKKGTATLTLSFPGPGLVVVHGAGVVKVTRTVKAGGRLRFTIKASGSASRTLRRAGKVALRVLVTYTPTGGKAHTMKVPVRLAFTHKKKAGGH